MGDGGVSDASPLLLQWTSSHVTEHRCTPAFLNKLMANALTLLQVNALEVCLSVRDVPRDAALQRSKDDGSRGQQQRLSLWQTQLDSALYS